VLQCRDRSIWRLVGVLSFLRAARQREVIERSKDRLLSSQVCWCFEMMSPAAASAAARRCMPVCASFSSFTLRLSVSPFARPPGFFSKRSRPSSTRFGVRRENWHHCVRASAERERRRWRLLHKQDAAACLSEAARGN
jgi:hypothetical protein